VPASVRPSIDIVVDVGIFDDGATMDATTNINNVAPVSRYYCDQTVETTMIADRVGGDAKSHTSTNMIGLAPALRANFPNIDYVPGYSIDDYEAEYGRVRVWVHTQPPIMIAANTNSRCATSACRLQHIISLLLTIVVSTLAACAGQQLFS
jgi:hypothetical protein